MALLDDEELLKSTISPTPRNQILGLLSDFIAQGYDPRRTQQMQGISKFLMAPEISQTLDRLSYDPSGRSLFTGAGGIGGTTRMRPEALDAALAVAPMLRAASAGVKPLAAGASMVGSGVKQAAPALRIGQFNSASADFQRPFRDMPINIEAVSPNLGQRGQDAFKEGLTERMIGQGGAYPMTTLGGRATTQTPGFGGYLNQAGIPESNPMRMFNVPNVMNIGQDTKLLESIANAGKALEQEAMAGVRFLPFVKNTPVDASAVFIKPPSGKITKSQFDDLFGKLTNDMVVVHDPKRGGAVIVPYGEVSAGSSPTEFKKAILEAEKTFGAKPTAKYGLSDYEKDRFFMEQKQGLEYLLDPFGKATPVPITSQIPKDAEIVREGLKYVEKRMFPESTSGIPGQVKATPMGGVQPWSRGGMFPTNIIGKEVNGKTMYQPINFSTGETGKLYPSAKAAEKEQQELFDKFQKFMAMQVGR